MAAIESKRSVSLAQARKKQSALSTQHSAREKHSAISTQHSAGEKQSAISTQHSAPKHQKPKKPNPRKRGKVPASLRFTTTKRGKTTVRRYQGRTFYRFDEVKGKTVDFVEVFVCSDYNCVEVRFDDKTALSFAIEPAFTLETEHTDWKTGNWRPIKRWPLIHSESNRR